jgi:hypothetical protein
MRPHEDRVFEGLSEAILRLVTALGLAAVTAFVPAAQSLSGRWSAAQPGTTVTFDLSGTGAAVTGTMIVTKQDGSSASGAVTTPAGWHSTARSANLVDDGGRTVLNVAAAPGEGVVWREPSALQDGTIEVELRGRDVVGQSFLGVAFRGLDDRTYEAVYFRPFNFATTDPDRRQHAVQYHSSPDNEPSVALSMSA